jgi:hypothetical protein
LVSLFISLKDHWLCFAGQWCAQDGASPSNPKLLLFTRALAVLLLLGRP